MRLVLAFFLIVLQHAVPGESRAAPSPRDPASTPAAATSPAPAVPADDPTLDTVLTRNHELSALLLPLIEAETSLLQRPKSTKKRLVEIRPLHANHGSDKPVALILTSDIPVHRQPKKLHVILDSHGIRQKKNYNNKHAAKHFFFKPQSSEENYSDEGNDHSGYDANEDFTDEDNSLSEEYNGDSYSSEELSHKRKNYPKKRKHFHFADISNHDFNGEDNSREQNIHKKHKFSKTFKHYHSVSGDSSKHSGKHHYWNKYVSESGSGSVETPTYEISKEEIVLLGPQNIQNYKDHTASDFSDEYQSNSVKYPSYEILDDDLHHKKQNSNFEFSSESHSESDESSNYKDSAKETVHHNQQSNQHEHSDESNESSNESSSYEYTDDLVDRDISNTQNIISEESKELENSEKNILVVQNEQLAENLFVHNSNSELEESLENTHHGLVIPNYSESFSSSEKHPTEDHHESIESKEIESKEVASHSDEYSESDEHHYNEDNESSESDEHRYNEDVSKYLNLILNHEDADAIDNNHHHHHQYYDSSDQDYSDEDASSCDTSESLNTEEYLNDDNDSEDYSEEKSLSAEHTHKHHDELDSHYSQYNHLISKLLEQQSSLDLSKKIIIQSLSGEDKSIEGIIEVVSNTAPKHVFKKSHEDDCNDKTVQHKPKLNKASDCHKEAHKTYKLSFRFNR